MASIADFEMLVPLDHGLSTVAIGRGGRPPHVTIVNAGVLTHPLTGAPTVGFVAAGAARKLALLRGHPSLAITIRAGWQWATVEGTVQLIGSDDPHPGVDEEQLRLLLRTVFKAAGGTHEDWDGYDQAMRNERRTAVLVDVDHVYSNPS